MPRSRRPLPHTPWGKASVGEVSTWLIAAPEAWRCVHQSNNLALLVSSAWAVVETELDIKTRDTDGRILGRHRNRFSTTIQASTDLFQHKQLQSGPIVLAIGLRCRIKRARSNLSPPSIELASRRQRMWLDRGFTVDVGNYVKRNGWHPRHG